MGELFGRDWSVKVADLELSQFDIRFRVEKSLKPEPNSALIEVFGLSADLRGYLAGLVSAKGKTKKIGTTARPSGALPCELKAGYIDPGPELIFLGDLLTVDSTRDEVGWVTSIGSGDGARNYRTARISQALGPGTPIAQALRSILKALGLKEGNAATVLGTLKAAGGATVYPRGIVLTGQASRRLTELCVSCGLEWSVQDGAVSLLARNTALPGQAFSLEPTSGLIGSPSVDPDGVMTCQCLIQPGVKCGGVVKVKSESVNGQYRIEKIVASGETRGQEWYYELSGRRY